MITSIETAIFKRKKGAKTEIGLLLNEGDMKIVDERGKIVRKIWSFQSIPGIALHDLKIGGKEYESYDVKMSL